MVLLLPSMSIVAGLSAWLAVRDDACRYASVPFSAGPCCAGGVGVLDLKSGLISTDRLVGMPVMLLNDGNLRSLS